MARFQLVKANSPVPASSGIRRQLQGKNRGHQGESRRTSVRKNRSLRYAEVVIAELIPEAGTVALRGAGLTSLAAGRRRRSTQVNPVDNSNDG